MKILLTGGAGFIATHTCVELMAAGHDVVVVDNYVNSQPEALRRVKRMKPMYAIAPQWTRFSVRTALMP